jgi:hypothetical protein
MSTAQSTVAILYSPDLKIGMVILYSFERRGAAWFIEAGKLSAIGDITP